MDNEASKQTGTGWQIFTNGDHGSRLAERLKQGNIPRFDECELRRFRHF